MKFGYKQATDGKARGLNTSPARSLKRYISRYRALNGSEWRVIISGRQTRRRCNQTRIKSAPLVFVSGGRTRREKKKRIGEKWKMKKKKKTKIPHRTPRFKLPATIFHRHKSQFKPTRGLRPFSGVHSIREHFPKLQTRTPSDPDQSQVGIVLSITRAPRLNVSPLGERSGPSENYYNFLLSPVRSRKPHSSRI